MVAIYTTSIDTILVWVGRAKRVWIYNTYMEDHARVLKGQFMEQLADTAKEGDGEIQREMRIELDQFGDLWLG